MEKDPPQLLKGIKLKLLGGSSREKQSDFRLISATNRNLDQMVSKGTFRKDLLHRIRTSHIDLPPLRERRTDIQELASFYLDAFCKKHQLASKAFLPETIEFLESYDWPGNVRELIHTIEQTILSEPGSSLVYPNSLPDPIRLHYVKQYLPEHKDVDKMPENRSLESILLSAIDKNTQPSLKEIRNLFFEKIEKIYLKKVLFDTGWNIDETARILGVGKNRVYVLVRKYHLEK